MITQTHTWFVFCLILHCFLTNVSWWNVSLKHYVIMIKEPFYTFSIFCSSLNCLEWKTCTFLILMSKQWNFVFFSHFDNGKLKSRHLPFCRIPIQWERLNQLWHIVSDVWNLKTAFISWILCLRSVLMVWSALFVTEIKEY